jgi:predicted metal-dependent enzyme (double-stranded beta helix superfamily)
VENFPRTSNSNQVNQSREGAVADDSNTDPSTWDPALDAAIAAPANHKVVFENDRLRVLEVILEPGEEEPLHHHRWPSVFVFDQVQGPIHDFAPDGTQLPPNRDVMQALAKWDGKGCLVVEMAPQPLGRVLNASPKAVHGIRVEMKTPK